MPEYWYNTCFHSAIQITPYEPLYGRPRPLKLPYLPGESTSAEVHDTWLHREMKLELLKHHLRRTQLRMKQQADSLSSDKVFEVGNWVYYMIHPYKKSTVSSHSFHKLAAKYYGPFQILRKVGLVAYTLCFPDSVKIHPTVHVSLLKRCFELPSHVSVLLSSTLPIHFVPILRVLFRGEWSRRVARLWHKYWSNRKVCLLMTLLGNPSRHWRSGSLVLILEERGSILGGEYCYTKQLLDSVWVIYHVLIDS